MNTSERYGELDGTSVDEPLSCGFSLFCRFIVSSCPSLSMREQHALTNDTNVAILFCFVPLVFVPYVQLSFCNLHMQTKLYNLIRSTMTVRNLQSE